MEEDRCQRIKRLQTNKLNRRDYKDHLTTFNWKAEVCHGQTDGRASDGLLESVISIQTRTTRVHQKKIRDRRLLLHSWAKLISTISKALQFLSFQMTQIRARGVTFQFSYLMPSSPSSTISVEHQLPHISWHYPSDPKSWKHILP